MYVRTVYMYSSDVWYFLQHAHKFKHVFTEGTGQTDIFDRLGFPLVEDLLQGKNGMPVRVVE